MGYGFHAETMGVRTTDDGLYAKSDGFCRDLQWVRPSGASRAATTGLVMEVDCSATARPHAWNVSSTRSRLVTL